MAEPVTIYRITVLYMLDNVDFPLTNTQISNFFLEYDYTDYFTIQQVLSSLIDSELIRFESTHSNTQYFLTAHGSETLSYFKEKITDAIRKDVKSFFSKNKFELKAENSVIADFYKTTDHTYDVKCQIKEKDKTLVDLTLNVKNKNQANAICENWQDNHMEVFTYLMDTLMK